MWSSDIFQLLYASERDSECWTCYCSSLPPAYEVRWEVMFSQASLCYRGGGGGGVGWGVSPSPVTVSVPSPVQGISPPPEKTGRYPPDRTGQGLTPQTGRGYHPRQPPPHLISQTSGTPPGLATPRALRLSAVTQEDFLVDKCVS